MSPAAAGGGGGSGDAAVVVVKKGPWTAAEDAILVEYVRRHGEGNWNAVRRKSVLQRCGKSCRLRWANHLRPNLKKGCFSAEEELLILRLHSQLGNKWARMAAHLPGRTDNEIKNYWNTRIKRRQRAGLPLYPPEIQSPVNTATHHIPSGPTAFNPASYRPQLLRMMMFQHYSPHTQMLFNGRPMQQQQQDNADLPLTQLFIPAAAPGDDLLDAMLQEAQAWRPDQSIGWGPQGGQAECPSLVEGPIGSNDQSDSKMKAETVNQTDSETTTMMHEDMMCTLLDMIPAAPATLLPNWCNSDTGEIMSSEGHSDDDIKCKMQQLASSISAAPVEGAWNNESSSWNNMPGICS